MTRRWPSAPLVVIAAAGLAWLVSQRPSGPWATHQIVGLAILIPAIALWALAHFELGASFTARPEARQLVTHGLYSRIRNPIYVFGQFVVLGVFTFLWIPWLYALFLILTPMQILRARAEARVLEEAFGDTYREWRRQTWF